MKIKSHIYSIIDTIKEIIREEKDLNSFSKLEVNYTLRVQKDAIIYDEEQDSVSVDKFFYHCIEVNINGNIYSKFNFNNELINNLFNKIYNAVINKKLISLNNNHRLVFIGAIKPTIENKILSYDIQEEYSQLLITLTSFTTKKL